MTKLKKSKTKKFSPPRAYLSWSSMNLFERNRDAWIRHYVFDQPLFTSNRMDFGKKIAEGLEDGDGDDDVQVLLTFLPKYSKSEYKLDIKGKLPLMGKLDSFDPRRLRIREYKTGVEEWTQNKVDNHGQITFYALMVYLKHKKLPSEMWLDWIPTKLVSGEVKMVGNIKSFKTERTMAQVMAMYNRASKVWKLINELDYSKLKHE